MPVDSGSEPLDWADDDPIQVLHVDDDGLFLETAEQLLQARSDRLAVTTATDPRTALDRVDAGAVECIVSDYDMPEMDGLAFLREVRERDPDVPFILFTGKGSEEIASDAISAGVTDYLQKGQATEDYAILANRITNAVEQRRAQRRAERERERFRGLIEHAADIITVLDEEGRITYASPSVERILGYDPDGIEGRHVLDFVHPEDEARVTETLSTLTAADHHRPRALECRVCHADGGWRWVSSVGSAPDGSSPIDGYVANSRDITERKRREEGVEGLQRAIRRMIQADSPAGVCEIAVEAAQRILDLPLASAWLHDEGDELLRPVAVSDAAREQFDEIPRYRPGDSLSWQAFASGEPVVYTSGDDRTTYNPETEVGLELVFPLGEHGVLTLASATETDYDDFDVELGRVLAEHTRVALQAVTRRGELDDERAFFESALDTIEDLFYVLDTEGRLIRWNEALEERSRYDPEEMEGRDALSFIHPEDREAVAAAMARAFESGSARVEGRLPPGDDAAGTYEFRARRLFDADDEVVGLCGIGRDVTERKRREDKLERQAERFEEFANVVSEDLQGPLETMRDRLALARETGDPAHFERCERAIDRVGALIDELLALARADEPTALELEAIARRCWRTVGPDRATLRIETDRTVEAHESRLRRLFENLYRSAVERAGEDVTVTVGAFEEGFYVADDGATPPAERERVLEGESGYSTDESDTDTGLDAVADAAGISRWSVSIGESEAGGTRVEIRTDAGPEAS